MNDSEVMCDRELKPRRRMNRVDRSTGENTMSKKANVIAIALLATMANSGVLAQMIPQAGGSFAPAPQGAQPAMPQAVAPAMPPAAPPGMPAATSAADPAAMAAGSRQANTLRQISEKKAELELLRIQGDIDKIRKPQEDAVKKQEAMDLQKELDAARKDQVKIAASAPIEDPGPPVNLLATFGSPGHPSASYAELKVGDLLVHAKVGDRLPSGHYVKAINFDYIELSKVQKPTASKRNKVIYITATDTANVYGSRGRSGETLTPAGGGGAAATPAGLPPMPAR